MLGLRRQSSVRLLGNSLGPVDLAFDIVELIKAPPILAFEAISGQELTRRDPHAHLDFVSLTSRRYANVCHSLESQMALGPSEAVLETKWAP